MRLIVHGLKTSNTNNDTNTDRVSGYVVPIAYENDDMTITYTNPSDFPNNNRIWISSGFPYIENSFPSDKIFYLNSHYDGYENDNSSNEILNDPTKCRYFSLGKHASTISSDYRQIYKLPALPDVQTGRLDSYEVSFLSSVVHPFFALVGDYVYGPFQIKKNKINEDEHIIFETVDTKTPLDLKSNHIAKFALNDLNEQKILLKVESHGLNAMYITSLHILKSSVPFETIDYISDSKLIQYYQNLDFAKDDSISKSQAKNLSASIQRYLYNNAVEHPERISRLQMVLDQFLNKEDQEFALIKQYFDSEQGHTFLNEFLSKHKDNILKDHIKVLKKENDYIVEELRAKYQNQIEDLKKKYTDEKLDIDNNIAQLRQDFEKQKESIKEQSEEIHNSKLNEELEYLQTQIALKTKELNNISSLVDLEQKITQKQGVLDHVQGQINSKQGELNKFEQMVNQQRTLLQNPHQLSDKAVEFATLRSIMTGANNIKEEIYEPVKLTPAAYQVTGETRISYINYLQRHINQRDGRKLSYNETANFMTTVMQTYLTIFSGLPGVGKTSTVHHFADALGIKGPIENKANFLNVAVARGWTSSKDLLGNKNALRMSYEEGRTGIYSMLKALEYAKSSGKDDIINHQMLSIILLDEANLSPIEHYWSDFLSICDTFHEGKKLNLGGKSNTFTLDLPPSLRFIATINTDATVEPLSDRLLDRASVITLTNENNNLDNLSLDDLGFNGTVPYQELAEAFMISREQTLKLQNSGKLELERNALAKIRHALESDARSAHPVYISNRKMNAIYNYCAVANQLAFENDVPPLDFAIAQHVIPKIRGYGKDFKERLIDLDKVCREYRLSRSNQLVKQILDNGSEFADTFSLL